MFTELLLCILLLKVCGDIYLLLQIAPGILAVAGLLVVGPHHH